MRARPEQTQLEDLSDASFLGKLLVFPANVRLDCKVIDKYKHSSLFGLQRRNVFITLTPGWPAGPSPGGSRSRAAEPRTRPRKKNTEALPDWKEREKKIKK